MTRCRLPEVTPARRGATAPEARPVPTPAPPKPVDPDTELAEARGDGAGLAGARRYRHAPLRWAGGGAALRALLAAAEATCGSTSQAASSWTRLTVAPLPMRRWSLRSLRLDSGRASEDAIAATRGAGEASGRDAGRRPQHTPGRAGNERPARARAGRSAGLMWVSHIGWISHIMWVSHIGPPAQASSSRSGWQGRRRRRACVPARSGPASRPRTCA